MPLVSHQWTCPICGESRELLAENESVVATNSLRTHIRASNDDQHGPPGQSPDDAVLDGLDRHVRSEPI